MKNFIRPLVVCTAICLVSSAVALASPIAPGFASNTLAANDDGSTAAINLGFAINFFGQTYSSTFVNNNGNITFTAPLSAYTPYGLAGSNVPIIAPFFADVDTRGFGSGLTSYGTGTYAGNAAFGATWPGVGYYPERTDKLDNFQVILVDRADTGTGNFDIYFNYGAMAWETGGASGGSDGLGGNCAVAGYSNGTAAGANQVTEQMAGSAVCGALIDGGVDALSSHTNDGVTGQYLFQARNGAITPPSEVPEPSSLVLLGTGVLGLAERLRRKLKV